MSDGIRLAELVVRAGSRAVVDGAGFTLGRGEIVGLVGSSGSGKTLTARSVLGLVSCRPGVVRADLEIEADGARWRPWDGVVGQRRRAVERAFRDIRGEIVGYLPQDAPAALDPLRTVGAQVRAAAALAGDHGDPRGWLERVGLTEPDRVARLHPHELSGGMAQRVVIAQALARRSRFLLADEPTTGLDPTVQQAILAELRALASRGAGILLITHDLRLLPDLADRVVLMDAGRTVETLQPDALARGRTVTEAGRRLVAATRLVAGGRLG